MKLFKADTSLLVISSLLGDTLATEIDAFAQRG